MRVKPDRVSVAVRKDTARQPLYPVGNDLVRRVARPPGHARPWMRPGQAAASGVSRATVRDATPDAADLEPGDQ
jgi:hypothetical protein